MSDEETLLDQNMGRLLRASCGAETRVAPAARRHLRQRLLAEWRAQFAPAAFPAGLLGVLSCLMLLLIAGLALAVWVRGPARISPSAWAPLGALVLPNVLFLPIACLVIILRRRLCRTV